MTAVTLPSLKLSSLSKLKKTLGLSGLTTAAFCLFDFMEVPKTFNSKYNSKAEKVEGKNVSGAVKETLKSIPKCLMALTLPLIITSLTATLGPVGATVGGILAFASPMLAYSCLNKLLPSETTLIEEACKEKGINLEA